MIYTLADTLWSSIKKANSQLPVLLKVFAALLLYLIRDFLFLAAIFAAGYYLHGTAQTVFYFLAVLGLLWLLVKLNGAVCLATVLVAAGQVGAMQMAKHSYKKGLVFFWNGLLTGVIMFGGQLLLVCPCFLLLDNFLFSPYLFVYENLKGTAARRRSQELAAGFGWVILNRTAIIIFIGYFFLIAVVLLFLIKLFWLAWLLVIIIGIYAALIQSNFIRLVYEQTVEMHSKNFTSTSGKYKAITIIAVLGLVLVYLAIKLEPELLYKYSR